jgi:Zn-finger nucleic acid-binding protein
MKCPTCTDTALVMSERQGIEIDYCPQCRGIWLDRGELDKIIEKATADAPAQPAPPPPPAAGYAPPPQQHYAPPPPHYGHGHGHYGHKRRKHWLEEIFD